MTVEQRFGELTRQLDYPMYVVTASAEGHNAGCLVGFASQMSLHPPRFLVGLSEKNHTRTVAASATHLAVHVIGREKIALARLFGEETGDEVDKFAECSWTTGPHGVPILDDADAWFVGLIVARVDLGDHVGHLLAPVDVQVRAPIAGMVTFADVRELDPGHDA